MKRLYLILAAALAVLLAGVGLARCSSPTVPPAPLPAAPPSTAPQSQAAASSSTAATLENDLEIIVPRGSTSRREGAKPALHPEEPGGQPEDRLQEDPIVIRIRQTATTAASSEASASAPVIKDSLITQPLSNPERFDHARLGVIVGPFPGAIAFSYQLADVEISPWVLGIPLEAGIDVEGNLSQVGAGISVGSKAFAAAGGYLGWNGPGWYVGLGMRF